MEIIRLISHYFEWYQKAKNRHGVHSPFMYHFNENCINKSFPAGFFKDIEKERELLLRNKVTLTFSDPGAGSKQGRKADNPLTTRRICDIARHSLKKPGHCRFLYSLAIYLGAKNILELGTSLGITTAYMARSGATVDTIEGAAEIADIAEGHFRKLQCPDVNLYRGVFDEVLPRLLNKSGKYDLIFIDGDHRGESLLKYFRQTVKHISPGGVIVIDDIRWSESMYDAWKTIIESEEVIVSADMFSMGLLFFRQGMSREKFTLRFK
jgi:predicted O-methyltransferase YrrM